MRTSARQVSRSAGSLLAALLLLAACDDPEERLAEHYERGMALLEEEDYPRANLEFRNALRIDDRHAPSRFEVGRLLERDGELRRALNNFRAAAELDPTHLDARKRLVRLMLLGGGSEQALSYSAQAVELAPRDPEALSLRATALLRNGRTEEALRVAETAIELDPSDSAAHLVRIVERYDRGDAAGALSELDAVLAESPEDRALNLMKLRILSETGDRRGLGAHLARLVEIYPEERSFRQARARWLLEQGDDAGAEAELRALAESDRGDVDAALDVVRFAASRKGPEAGREALVEAIEAAPDLEARTRLRLALADYDRGRGEGDRALAELRDVLDDLEGAEDVDRLRDDARTGLATLLLARGETDEVRRLVETVLERDESNVRALALRASLLIDAYEPARALRDLRRALDLEPQNVDLLLLAARAHERNGSPSLQEERLAAAARVSDFRPDVALRYAGFLRGAGRLEASETVLSESARRNPRDVEILAALAETRLRLEDWIGAEDVAAQLDAVRPEVADRVRAATLNARGRFAESVAMLEDIAEASAGEARAVAALISAYVRSGRLEEARAYLDARLAEEPEDIPLRLLRADLHLAEGDPEAAGAILRSIVETRPQSGIGHVALARFHLARGDLSAASAAAANGVARAEDPNAVRMLYAGILENEGDFAGAVDQYRALYEAGVDSVVVANNLAALLADHFGDDPELLAEAARISLRLRSSDVPEFQDTYGWIQYLQGDYEASLRSLAPAAEARPQNAWIRFHAGMAFAKLDRVEDARDHLNAALAIDPDFIRADVIEAELERLDALE